MEGKLFGQGTFQAPLHAARKPAKLLEISVYMRKPYHWGKPERAPITSHVNGNFVYNIMIRTSYRKPCSRLDLCILEQHVNFKGDRLVLYIV